MQMHDRMREDGPIQHAGIQQAEAVTVVVIDDHVMFAEGVSASLSRSDGVVVQAVATTATEGARAVREHRPDVVLVDYGLPDEDGISLAARLHAERPDMGIVIVTSLVDERLAMRAVEAGCAGFLTKDQSVDELIAAIRLARAGEPLISSAMLGRLLRRFGESGRKRTGSRLTDRETEVLELVCEGLTNPAIAERLHLSHNTVRSHVQSILSKLQVHSKLEAAVVAARDGLIEHGRPSR